MRMAALLRGRRSAVGRQHPFGMAILIGQPRQHRIIRLRSTTEESVMETLLKREAWNKGKLVGQKPPLKPKDIWAIRIHLQNAHAVRDLAMFNLAIDSKLRGCDLVRVRDISMEHRSFLAPWSFRGKRSDRCNLNSRSQQDRRLLPGWKSPSARRGSIPLPEQGQMFASYLHTPICTYRASLGCGCWTGLLDLRNPLDAADQSHVDL